MVGLRVLLTPLKGPRLAGEREGGKKGKKGSRMHTRDLDSTVGGLVELSTFFFFFFAAAFHNRRKCAFCAVCSANFLLLSLVYFPDVRGNIYVCVRVRGRSLRKANARIFRHEILLRRETRMKYVEYVEYVERNAIWCERGQILIFANCKLAICYT